jgi:hypothetical protein
MVGRERHHADGLRSALGRVSPIAGLPGCRTKSSVGDASKSSKLRLERLGSVLKFADVAGMDLTQRDVGNPCPETLHTSAIAPQCRQQHPGYFARSAK